MMYLITLYNTQIEGRIHLCKDGRYALVWNYYGDNAKTEFHDTYNGAVLALRKKTDFDTIAG